MEDTIPILKETMEKGFPPENQNQDLIKEFSLPLPNRVGSHPNACPIGFHYCCGPMTSVYYPSFPFLQEVCVTVILSLFRYCVLSALREPDNLSFYSKIALSSHIWIWGRGKFKNSYITGRSWTLIYRQWLDGTLSCFLKGKGEHILDAHRVIKWVFGHYGRDSASCLPNLFRRHFMP